MRMNLCERRSFGRLAYWLGLATLFTSLAPGLPRGLLRSELEGSIRKWVVRDSAGLLYLLSPRKQPTAESGFLLRVSNEVSPRSLGDFGAPPSSGPTCGCPGPNLQCRHEL